MKTIGNPAAAMAASEALKDKSTRKDIKDVILHVTEKAEKRQNTAMKIGKGIVITGGVILGLSAVSKMLREGRKKRLLASAGTDPDVGLAILIYDEIPAKLKKSHIPIIGPIFDSVKKLDFFSYSNDNKLIGYAQKVQKIATVEDVFKIVFEEDFYTLMQATMSAENFVKFMEIAKKDKTPFNTVKHDWANRYAVAKKDTVIYRIAVNKNTNKIYGITIPVTKGAAVGKATGTQKRYVGKDYMETNHTLTLNNKKYKMTFYVHPDDVKLENEIINAGKYFNIKVYPETEVLIPVK